MDDYMPHYVPQGPDYYQRGREEAAGAMQAVEQAVFEYLLIFTVVMWVIRTIQRFIGATGPARLKFLFWIALSMLTFWLGCGQNSGGGVALCWFLSIDAFVLANMVLNHGQRNH